MPRTAGSNAADPTLTHGPVGWDTYRHLDQLPTLPAGVQTQQFASTDPAGRNQDFSHTLGQTPDGSSILARYQGSGEIDAIWTTSNGGDVTPTGNIKITLDGQVVLDAPEQDVVNGALGAPFTFPLVANADQSSGGDYIDVPMPFRSSMLVTTTSDPVFYHVEYRKFDDPTGVSTFNPQQDSAQDVVSQLAAAGTTDPKGPQPGQSTTKAAIAVTPGNADTLGSFQGPARINALQLTLPQLSQVSNLSPQAIGTAPTASTAATGPASLGINPNNNGLRVSRRLQAGAGDAGADILVGGTKVASFPPTAPGAASSAHWAAQTVTLPTSATAGQSSIHVVPSSTGNSFAYQATYLPSPAVAAAISATDDVLQNVRLRITFDGQQTVDAPLGQFFGSGLGGQTVKALMEGVNPQTNTLSAWWPMPYAQQATVALYNGSKQSLGGTSQITTAPASGETQALGPSGQDGYFHATANAQNPTVSGQDYSFLSTASWGKFVGVSQTLGWLVSGPLGTCILEGNEQAYADGSPTAQLNGTGTEDFYQGGWYFNRGQFSNALNGAPTDDDSGNCEMNISAYRLMLADAVPFGSSNNFGIQHGPLNTTPANYSSTAYWYGRSGASPDLYHALPLQNGWTQASGTNTPAYVEEGNYVRLLGAVKGGSVGQPLAILPRSLAPRADEWFPVVTANNVVAPLVVYADGTVTLAAGNSGFVSLSGIVLDVGSSTEYQPLGLQNGWAPAPGTYPPGWSPGYVQNGDYVELTGGLHGGGINQVVATLPSNLAPAADEWFPVVTANDVVAPLVVHSDGTIVLNGGDPGFLSLAGVGVMVGPPPSSNLALLNGWSQDPGTNPPGFTQRGREVDLRGGIRGGNIGQTIATLPSAARPANDEWLPAVTANEVVGPVVAHPAGNIVLTSGETAFLSLESLRISAGVVSPVAPVPPGAPTIGRATAGNAQASVTFAPPADDGGFPVTSYTVTANDLTTPAQGGQTASGPASPIFVTGLTNGDSYTFTVTATNAAGTGPASAPSNAVTPMAPPPFPYHPLAPTRITDTRPGSGQANSGQSLGPNATLNVQVTGALVPAGATAAVLNVTATDPTAQGFLTVWPTGSARPTASNLNFSAGETVPNLVEVGLGTNGQVSVYNSSGSVDVVVDLEGYVGSPVSASTGLYNPLTPARITDTRPGSGQPNAGSTLGPGSELVVQVSGAGGVPGTGAGAVVLNVTATNPTAQSFLTVWPTGSTRPTASNLNFSPGQTVPNRVIVPVGSGGEVSIYNPAGSVDAIVDVGGYFTDGSNSSATGSQFTPAFPTRITDTRPGSGSPNAGDMLSPRGILTVQVSGAGDVPSSGVTSAVMNVTATDTTASSFLTAWSTGVTRPLASDLNWIAGETVPNLVVVKLGSDGAVQVYNAAGSTDVVVDVSGWYS